MSVTLAPSAAWPLTKIADRLTSKHLMVSCCIEAQRGEASVKPRARRVVTASAFCTRPSCTFKLHIGQPVCPTHAKSRTYYF